MKKLSQTTLESFSLSFCELISFSQICEDHLEAKFCVSQFCSLLILLKSC